MKKILIPAISMIAIFIVIFLVLQAGNSSQMGRKMDVAEKTYHSGAQYIVALKNDMAKHYQDATGQKIRNNCLIVANENYEVPNFCPADIRPNDGIDTSGYIYVITLNNPDVEIIAGDTSLVSWSDNIFELGHEMTHYVCQDYMLAG